MNCTFHAGRNRNFQRGGVYLAVLGVAMLVTVIGLSGVLATRVARRSAALSQAATQADTTAQCFMDVALYRLTHDLYWRINYQNDTWTAPEMCGDATAAFKLVDELDGDLANNENHPARLYCKATVGEAMRMYSLRFTARPPVVNNLLLNSGFEGGTSSWYGYHCNINTVATPRHSGSAAVSVTSRSDNYGGPTQTMTGVLEKNQTYELEAWVRTASNSAVMRFVLYYCDTLTGCRTLRGANTTVTDNWTRVTATFTPTSSGSLTDSWLNVSSESGTGSFYVDDVIMRKEGSGQDGVLLPVPGSFQREVMP